MPLLLITSFLTMCAHLAQSTCPYMDKLHGAAGDGGSIPGGFYPKAYASIDWVELRKDIEAVLTDSKPFWPADGGNYGPFFIRQAWHCAGSYRTSDGRGGCDGARQRFDPEMSWGDNTNLDKGKILLQPIKIKYGKGLSWGDLIVMTANVAIESMGGPAIGFCGGRIDDLDGAASAALGPSIEQQKIAPCPKDGDCPFPLGANVMGNIYVNPAGFMGVPVPKDSAPDIRAVFGRMGMNDSETVALIGGGHAFGKTHGACPSGPGPSPQEDPYNSWPGTCGSGPMKGKGLNTFTSGFEGPWTTAPSTWTNDYFENLLSYDWKLTTSPAGKPQWKPMIKGTDTPAGIPIMMLTTDVALLEDPEYLKLVKLFATDIAALEHAFSAAWYKLTTRDMGPRSRCLPGDRPVPAAYDWQFPLPAPPSMLPKWNKVKAAIRKVMMTRHTALLPDIVDGKPSYQAMFAMLAWQCASTFRTTNYRGGCNGASIRFEPESNWPMNAHMDGALQVLSSVKKTFGDSLSWADLIVLAGKVAVEDGGASAKFCGGRTDYTDGTASSDLVPWDLTKYSIADPVWNFRNTFKIQGLTPWEAVALRGNLRSPQQMKRLGYSGSWTSKSSNLNNEYFKVLLSNTWKAQISPQGVPEWKAEGKELYMMPEDIAVKYDFDELLTYAQTYASDKQRFITDFSSAWMKMMNADRFKGPDGTVCKD